MTTTAAPAEDDTAAAFIPQAETLTFNGQAITVQPLAVMQAIQIGRVLKQVLPSLDRMAPLLKEGDVGAADVPLLVELLSDFGEPMTEAVAIATGLPLQDVQRSRDIAGLIGVIAAIVRVNVDFFAQQVAPYLAGLRNAAAANGAGPTPSTPLSAPATA